MKKKSDEILVNLYLDNKCNLKCSYCFEENNIISVDGDLESTIRYLDEILSENKVMIDMCGREMSLAYPKYDYVFSRLKNYHNIISLNTITNGYHAPDEFIEFLKKYDVKSLAISIDIGERLHNINRKSRCGLDTYGTIIENVKKYRDLGIRLTASSVYDPKNVVSYKEFSKHVDTMIECGFVSYKIAFLNDTVEDKPADVLYIHNLVYNKILDLHKSEKTISIRLGSGFDIVRLEEYLDEEFTIDCNARRSVTLSPGSKKYSCMLALTDPKVFKNKELFEVRGKLYGNELIQEATKGFSCMICNVKIFCRGACPMLHMGDGVDLCIQKRRLQAKSACVFWKRLTNHPDYFDIVNKVMVSVGKKPISVEKLMCMKDTVNNIIDKLTEKKG